MHEYLTYLELFGWIFMEWEKCLVELERVPHFEGLKNENMTGATKGLSISLKG